jgi:hypothetical protein
VSDDDELIRLYTIGELFLQHRKTEWSVDLSLPVSITVVRMDGVEYVASLTNYSGIASRQTRLIIPSEFSNFYIANDHLGIRRVTSNPKESSLDTVHPAYWKTVSTNRQTITFRGDVSLWNHLVYQKLTPHAQSLKLRELLTPSIYPRVLWPHPVTQSELDSMAFYYAGWGEGDLEARLRTLVFNELGTTGYSVCWTNDEMVSIHVHRNMEDQESDRTLMNEHTEFEHRSLLKWTYYPIQKDEFIQEVWLRGSEKYDTTRLLPSQGEGGLQYHLSTPWGLTKYKRPSDIALAVRFPMTLKSISHSTDDTSACYEQRSKHCCWKFPRPPWTILVIFETSSLGLGSENIRERSTASLLLSLRPWNSSDSRNQISRQSHRSSSAESNTAWYHATLQPAPYSTLLIRVLGKHHRSPSLQEQESEGYGRNPTL